VRRLGLAVLAAVALLSAAAPLLTSHAPDRRFDDRAFAPPMPLRFIDAGGTWRAPFVYPQRLENRLERRFSEDRTRPLRVAWFSGGVIASVPEGDAGPWLPLGADAAGRDVFARLLHGARLSLGVALLATLGALLIGALVGGLAGVAGGVVDDTLMRVADFVIVLPAMYVVLSLRAALPLVLGAGEVFALIAGIMALVGWPIVARGVRAIVAAERARDYAQAALALGITRRGLLRRHLLPAAGGFLATQAALLVPAFMLGEATLSFVGLGFPDTVVSWGSMLQEASSATTLSDAPWTLAPAAAMFLVVLAVNLATAEQHARVTARTIT
jgi:peptide/nickel transport system permease protein